MKVILKTDVDNLGKLGDSVEVSKGYARNYLLPKGLVWPYEDRYLKQVESLKKKLEEKLLKEKENAESLAVKIEDTSITIEMEAGDEDKLFGTVTNSDISEKLISAGIEVDKKDITIVEPIKKLGVYKVEIKLHPEVIASCKVWVVKK